MRVTGALGLQAPGQLQESPLSIDLKGKMAIGVSAVAVAAFAGGAFAATREPQPTGRQAFLNDAAKRLHVTPDHLSAALRGAAIDQLNRVVAAGRLTQAQADAIKKQIESGQDPVPGPFGWFGEWREHQLLGPGAAVGPPAAGSGGTGGNGSRSSHAPWPGGSPGPAGPRPWPGGSRGSAGQVPWHQLAPGAAVHGPLQALATYLGLTPEKLLDQLRSGESLAEIAKAQGKSPADLHKQIAKALADHRFAIPGPGKPIPYGSWRSAPKGSASGPAGLGTPPPAGPGD